MPKNKSATAKFKIYKIKYEYSINGILDDIKGILNEKLIPFDEINNKGYSGIIYSNNSKPSWLNCIHELVSKNIKEKYQENKNLSYVLFKKSSNNFIYGISGGRGYLHIKEYCEKNYGLNLIPKLINNTDDVVRTIVENRLYDNQIYNHRINRRATNLNLEFNFTNLYKELGLILDNKMLIDLHLIDDNHFSDLEYIRISNKDYVYIEKSLTIKNLDYILDWLDSINERPVNFELNSFIPLSNSENRTSNDLLELLLNNILNEESDDEIEIVGENIEEFLQNDEYSIECNEINFNMHKEDHITWNDIIEFLKEKSLFNNDYLRIILKKAILITFKDGKITLNSNLFDCLDCKIYDTITNLEYFLLDGNWYYLDDTFEEIIFEKFSNIHMESEKFSRDLVDCYPSLKNNWIELYEQNETNYNNSFEKDSEVILFHPLKPNHIEIADMLIYNKDSKKLYLICIKDNFSYPGCRDLYGQIKGSYKYLKNDFSRDDEKIQEYYVKICEKNDNDLPITQEEFKTALNGNFCYIAGFFNNFQENPTLPVKILTNNIFSYLNNSNVEFYIINFNFQE